MVTILYGNEENCIAYVKNKCNKYQNISGHAFILAYLNNADIHKLYRNLVINCLQLDKDDEDMQLYTSRIFKFYEVLHKELYLINPFPISAYEYGDVLYYNLQRATEIII